MATIPIDISGLVDGQQADAADVLVPLLQLRDAVENILEGTNFPFEKSFLDTAPVITIVGGVATPTKMYFKLETEGSLATDDLNTISAFGNIILVQLNSAGQTVTFYHGVGNIWFSDGRNVILDNTTDVLVFRYNAVQAKWIGDGRFLGSLWLSNSVLTPIVSDQVNATQSKLVVQAESGTTDNLTTVNNSNNFSLVTLTADAGDTITVKHNTGNIWFPTLLDYTLTGDDTLTLIWNDFTSNWVAIGINSNLIAVTNRPVTNTLSATSFVAPFRGFENLGANKVGLPYRIKPVHRRTMVCQAVGGTTMADEGLAWTNVGAPTDVSGASSNFVKFTSSTTLNNRVSRQSSTNAFRWQWNPSIEIYLQLPAASDSSNVIGFVDSLPTSAGAGADPTVNNGMVLHLKGNGSSITPSLKVYQGSSLIGTMTMAFTLNALEIMRIRIWIESSNDTVYFQINNDAILSLAVAGVAALASVNLTAFFGAICAVAGTAGTLSLSRITFEAD